MLIYQLLSRKVIRPLFQITVDSLQPVLSVVFESIIKDHLISYLLENDLLCVEQFGLKNCRSTGLQLFDVLNDLRDALEINIE